MTTSYAVIRYVPDPISGERINVGVLVWDDEQTITKFTDDWKRVSSFGKRSVVLIKEFERWLASGHSTGLLNLHGETRFSPDDARNLAGQWGGVIQISEPHASTLNLMDTLAVVQHHFLRGKPRTGTETVDREAAVRQANTLLRKSLQVQVGPEALALIHPSFEVPGIARPHRFDFVVGNDNDVPVVAMHAFSLRAAAKGPLLQQVDAFAFAVSDVRDWIEAQSKRRVRFAAFVIPPVKMTKEVEQAYRVFRLREISTQHVETIDHWIGKVTPEIRAALNMKRLVV